MIRNRNIDHSGAASFTHQAIVLALSVGASVTAGIVAGFRAPYKGKVVAAHVYAATLTDADDSARIDLRKNGTTMLGATVDPVAADTATSLAPTTLTFDEGDKIQVYATTGSGDAMVGSVTVVIRPLLGREV